MNGLTKHGVKGDEAVHQLPAAAFVLLQAYAKIVCEPNWKWHRREKPLANYDLFYVWSGEGEVVLNGEPYPVGAGSCFLFRPGDHTSAVHNAQRPLTLTYIHFDLSCEPGPIPASYRVVRDDRDWFEKLLTRYVRVRLRGGFGSDEEARLVLQQLMVVLLREEQELAEQQGGGEGGASRLVEAVRETANFIRLHPGRTHRLDELAVRAGLSPKYYSAKFKELIGEPVQTYVVRARIERAEHLLRYAGMTVSEVADALGYRDVFFFSRQFKRYTGVNPSRLR